MLIGRRSLPPRLQSVVELLAPVMLVALVTTQTFGGDEEIEVDARVVGVGAAVVAIVFRATSSSRWLSPPLATALVRFAF